MKPKLCELCNNEEASLYCGPDNAFLCKNCDAKVHGANFLVARHIRHIIYSNSQILQFPNSQSYLSPSSSSSDCISTTKSSVKNSTRFNRCKRTSPSNNAEGVFVNWYRALGIYGNENDDDVAAGLLLSSASDALGLCLQTRFAVALPFHVCLAAAFWFGWRSRGGASRRRSLLTWQNLKRLEQVSGVPFKLILAVEMKLARATIVRKRLPRHYLVEGWAESS